jgi:integrator complex subunit 2
MDGAAKAFAAISLFDEQLLNELSSDELRPLLPCLTRMAFCPSLDNSNQWTNQKKRTLQLISHLEEVNLIVSLLSVDFQVIENEWKRNGRQKMNECLSTNSQMLVELESSNPGKKLLLFMHEVQQLQQRLSAIAASGNSLLRPISSELFDHDIYMDAMSDMACVLLAELPHSFSMNDLIDTLLAVRSGPLLICRLALNFPHAFDDICSHLLSKDEFESELVFAVERRIQVLRALCRLNPSHSLLVRSQALTACRLPALCVYLTIDHMRNTRLLSSSSTESTDEPMEVCLTGERLSSQSTAECNELVSFVSGVLLGDDDKRRQWFIAYIRGVQKKTESASSAPSVLLLRNQLHQHCQHLYQLLQAKQPPESIDSSREPMPALIQASALLKLYCAFRGLCTLKLFDNEIVAIVNLITIRPPSNAPGIRFASIGLCMLLAAPSLTATGEQEKQVLHWLQDIVSEPSLFGHLSGSRSSFCEMLLLIAIHFHSNQSSAIGDLVSTVLGIKVPVRQNNLIKMKAIFTQEIFPDHAVTAHAIKVPVTNRLNSEIPGFLPVHCIYQLLKSRAFTKHKVSRTFIP